MALGIASAIFFLLQKGGDPHNQKTKTIRTGIFDRPERHPGGHSCRLQPGYGGRDRE